MPRISCVSPDKPALSIVEGRRRPRMGVRYRRRSGGLGPLVVVLGLVAVLGGLLYTFRDRIKSYFAGRERERVVSPGKARPSPRKPRIVKKPKPARVKPRRPKPPVARPPRRVASKSNRRRAKELRLQAETALEALDFKIAAELFGKEARMLERDPEAAEAARALRTKAETFFKVTSDIELNPEAAGKTVLIKTAGAEHEVVIIKKTRGEYIVRRRSGITFTLPVAEVRSIKPIPREVQRRRLRNRFAKAVSKTTEKTGPAYYLLAEHAYKDGLKGEALSYLNKAFAEDGKELPRKIRIHEAKTWLKLAIWCLDTGRTNPARTYCRRVERKFADLPGMVAEARDMRERMEAGSKVAANYKSTVTIRTRPRKKPAARRVGSPEGPDDAARSGAPAPAVSTPSPEEEKVTVETATVRSKSGSNRELIAKINKLFEEGMDHYIKGRPGRPRSNFHLSKAAKLFRKVSALCGQALRNDPGNAQIESRQTDATRFAYHAQKMKTLSLFGG